MDYTLIHLWNL